MDTDSDDDIQVVLEIKGDKNNNTSGMQNVQSGTMDAINAVITTVYDSERMSDEDMSYRETVLADLKSVLSQHFGDIILKPYGSFSNGFGTKHSDLDVCAKFEYDTPGEKTKKEMMDILQKFTTLLKASKEFRRAVLIRARVPIVRFWHGKKKFEGDISLENDLAPINTQLLRTYTDIDERVKILGLFLKTVVKMCDVSDASKGGLTSYGFALMLIHYLQQVQPPVLPVLQEIYTDADEPLLATNRNTRFFRDVPNLDKVWPHKGKNTMTVAELWLGFLKYYENFNHNKQDITVRQLAPLPRTYQRPLKKGGIGIEDAFDMSRYVSKNISKETADFILDIFSWMIDTNYQKMLESQNYGYQRWKNGRFSSLFINHPRGHPKRNRNSGNAGSTANWRMYRERSLKKKEASLAGSSRSSNNFLNNGRLSPQNNKGAREQRSPKKRFNGQKHGNTHGTIRLNKPSSSNSNTNFSRNRAPKSGGHQRLENSSHNRYSPYSAASRGSSTRLLQMDPRGEETTSRSRNRRRYY